MTTRLLLVVDAASAERCRTIFPGMDVAGNAGPPEDDFSAEQYRDRQVLLWCHYARFLAEKIAPVAAKVGIVEGERYPASFNGSDVATAHWLRRSIIQRYAPEKAPAEPPEPHAPVPAAGQGKGNGSQPESAGEAQRPIASVTPITEARTTEQRKKKPRLDTDDYTPFADDVLAKAFTATYPQLRYVARWGKWMEWQDDKGWREDDTLHVYDLARKVCCDIASVPCGATPSQVAGAKSAAKRASVENLARADRVHAISADVWDTDKLKLNTPAGLIDLTNGSIRPTRVDDYCRKITNACMGSQIPEIWTEFLKQTTDGNAELQDYLRRLAGMCATGDTREDFLGFIYGPGGNGKSVFIDTIQNILGTYAINAGIETFTEQKNDKHTTELARLFGARLVVAQETEQGRRWAESRLKLLTGGGKVTARFMRCDDFEFTPELKLIIVGNHKPSLRNVDEAFRRRFNLIPFVHKPPVIDKQLRHKLWAQRDGILTWIIAGCIEWLQDGLRPPESVRAATEEYFETQDIIGQWIAECCETGPGCTNRIQGLFQSYRGFCEKLHEFALRQGELRDALMTREGITLGGYKTAPVLEGIRVKVDTDRATGAANGYRDD